MTSIFKVFVPPDFVLSLGSLMIPRLKCLCSWGSEYGRKSYFCLSNFIFILGHLTVITQTFTLQHQIFRGCQTHRPKSNQKFPRYNMKCSGKHDTI